MKDLLSPVQRKTCAFFFIFLMLFYAYGCRYYLKARSVPAYEIPQLEEIGEIHKYFVVHSGEETRALINIQVDSMQLVGRLDTISKSYYYSPGRSERYKVNSEREVVHEVHLYLQNYPSPLDTGDITIPLASIRELVIIDKDTGRTVLSHFFGFLGYVIAPLVVLTIIVALTKSSCPYVYAYDGNGYPFAGEIFAGAILQNLERDDYLPLPQAQPIKGQYQLRITNELKERQYTNLANLLAVNHPAGSQVLLDRNGKAHLIQAPQLPLQATSATGEKLDNILQNKDRSVFLFNETTSEENYLQLQFEKPPDATNAKLLLRAKNTLWLDYLYGDFTSQFGIYYDQWTRKQEKMHTAERMEQIINAEFPLSIYVRTQDDWQLVDRLMTVGPLADRDFVIPIDLEGINTQNLEIKIESGFMFWEIDYAALDFSPDAPLEIHRIRPQRAPASDGRDYTQALAEVDEDYLPQLSVGEVAQLYFQAPSVSADQQQSVFLHARGYYELIREYEGWPKFNELRKFEEPGYFSGYSKMRYQQVLGEQEKYLVEKPSSSFIK